MIKNLLREILLIIITILLLGCSLADSNEKRIEIYTPANDQENLIEVGLNESDSYKLDSKYTHKMISNILYESRDISISLWLKPQANFNWTTILSAGFDQNNFYQLATSGNPDGVNTGLVFSICKDGNIERIMSQSNKKLEVGVYNFVVLTIKDKQTSIYLNGELVGTSITRNIIKDINTKEMIIGKSQFFDDPVFEGKFQELTVYNYALDESSIKEKYNELLPCVVLDSIVFDSFEIFQNDVFLPYINKLSVSWESSHPSIINNQGEYITKERIKDDLKIELLANIEYGGKSYEKEFRFVVLSDSYTNRINKSINYIKNEYDHIFYDEQELISVINKYGTIIEWTVIDGPAIVVNNHLVKTNDTERSKISLNGKIVIGDEYQDIKIDGVLLDEKSAYLMSYFNGDYEQEVGKLAYSYDGLNWTCLNHCEPVITSELGSKRIRDPHISRDKNGEFIISATQGWDNAEIYLWRSKDLIDFYDHKLLKITINDSYINLTGERAWAPEIWYDDDIDKYVIIFSDPKGKDNYDGSMYYVTTDDFNNISYVSRIIKTEYPIIDAVIFTLHGDYWAFYKDNYAGTIFTARSNNSRYDLNWETYDEEFIFNTRYIEGPFILKRKDDYLLYVDNYKHQRFYVAKFTHLGEKSDLAWLDDSMYSMPESDVRHASVIDITQIELQRLIEFYDK